MLKILAPSDDAFTTACAILDEAKLDYFHNRTLREIVLYPADGGAHIHPLELIEAIGCQVRLASVVVR